MAKIKHIAAREIFNGLGNPTLEVAVTLSDDNIGVASVPSGITVGTYEAIEVHDHDTNRFGGLGVQQALLTIEQIIAPKLEGIEATHQQQIDRTMIELDGTQNKSRLGANTMLAISIACAKAAAASSVLPLFLYLRAFISKTSSAIHIPTPLFTIFENLPNESTLNFQQFLLIPATSKKYNEATQMYYKINQTVKELFRANNLPTLSASAGGITPLLSSNIEACNFLAQAVANTGFRFGFDVFLGIDASSHTFYHSRQYKIIDKESPLSSKDMATFYADLAKQFPLLYLEDGLSEDDWEGWNHLYTSTATQLMLAGDDLIATNPYRLQTALNKRTINTLVIHPNQIGTVLESLAIVEVARAAGLKIVVSNRSGDTNDSFLADFAVAVAADYVKFGSFNHGEHVAKYNRLLQIQSQLKML